MKIAIMKTNRSPLIQKKKKKKKTIKKLCPSLNNTMYIFYFFHHNYVSIQSNRYETYYWTGEKLRFTFMNLTNGERDLRMIPQTRRTKRKKEKKGWQYHHIHTHTQTQALATVWIAQIGWRARESELVIFALNVPNDFFGCIYTFMLPLPLTRMSLYVCASCFSFVKWLRCMF